MQTASHLQDVSSLSDGLLRLLQARGKLPPQEHTDSVRQGGFADQAAANGSAAHPFPASSTAASPLSGGMPNASRLPSQGSGIDEPSWSNYNLWSGSAAGPTNWFPGTTRSSPDPTPVPLLQQQGLLQSPLDPALLDSSAGHTSLPSLSLLQPSAGWQPAVQQAQQQQQLSGQLSAGLLQSAQLSGQLRQPQISLPYPGLPDGTAWQRSGGGPQVSLPQGGAAFRPVPGSAGLAPSAAEAAYGLPSGPHSGPSHVPNSLTGGSLANGLSGGPMSNGLGGPHLSNGFGGVPLGNGLTQLPQLRTGPRMDQGLLGNGRDVPQLMGGVSGQPPFSRPDWPKGSNGQASARSGKASKGTVPMHRKPYSPLGANIVAAGPAADPATLNTQLQQLFKDLQPLPTELEARAQAYEMVRSILLTRWPEAVVHVFGSSANSLSICNNNDIDMTLELAHLPDVPGAKAAVVEEMGRLFLQAGVKDVLLLPKARVPVVKLVAPATGTKIDLTVNNLLAIVNTKLLKDYAAIDPRLAQLVFVVKHWAKRRQVNDAYRGTLSSYCYALMCIAHLQHRSPPILPCLQALPPTHIRSVGRWNCDYHDRVEALQGYGAANTETLGDLVWSFFEFWAWRHDFNNSVVTIRTLTPLSKAEKEWTKRVGNERHLVSIEDPFELSHDLGRTMDRQTTSVLHKEFERAAGLLRDDPEPLSKLFEPYRTAKYDA